MKVTPNEFKKIIKEESIRLKKRMMLESERDGIIKKLNEMESCDMMEEGLTPEQVAAKTKELTTAIDGYLAKGAIGNKDLILQKAAENNYLGSVTARKSVKDNKWYILYTPGQTTFQKIISPLTGGMRGGHNFGGGAQEE